MLYAAIKPEIVDTLERYRDEELGDRREKRRKALEEELAKKTAAAEGKKTDMEVRAVTISENNKHFCAILIKCSVVIQPVF